MGVYFAWDEVETKEYYWWYNYKWVENTGNSQLYFTKYNNKSTQGVVDDKVELDPEDDAAHVNWGPEWRMPSRDQCNELIDNCTVEWAERNGINGRLFIGANGNTIFMPAAGIRLDYDFSYGNTKGFYWGRSICIISTSHVVAANGVAFYLIQNRSVRDVVAA